MVYDALFKKNVQKTYKKSTNATINDINHQSEIIANKLKLEDRIEKIAHRDAFITLKDHKENFVNRPTCRLINPAKSEIGKISKQILQKIVAKTSSKSGAKLWTNTSDVLKWFNGIQSKENTRFILFDIAEFYPSITEELLLKAISFSEKFQEITTTEKDIIIQSKRTILFADGEPWVKKEAANLFDVTMGSYDGAEACELVGTFILHQLKGLGEMVGLYRDDGLMATESTPKQAEQIKKNICKIFKDNGLKITIDANKKIVNFLDVTLDLQKQSHYPYMKPGNVPIYVNAKSNHPPNVLKAIPKGINKRLSEISSNQYVFEQATAPYKEAIEKSGYNYELKYTNQAKQPYKRTRTRKVTWYNPPYDQQVKKDIGRQFMQAVEKYLSFPKESKLHNKFNKNTIKLSYSCMPNVKAMVDMNNKRVLCKRIDNMKDCNCRNKKECPLQRKCNDKSVVYQATVETATSKESYVGLTEGEFKTRWTAHKHSFRNEKQMNSTELSKHVWKLKSSNKEFNLQWKILGHAKAYSNTTKRCNLCILEKYFIICHSELATLNKRTELINCCRHSRKHLLGAKSINGKKESVRL